MKPLSKYPVLFNLPILYAFICLVLFPSNAMSGQAPLIRVLIMDGSKKIIITCQGRVMLATEHGKALETFTPQEKGALEFSPLPSGININSKKYDYKLLMLKSLDSQQIKIGNYSYRGDILIYLNNHWALEAINRICLEDYIKGLMKAEISPSWPVESLKAQAVVARTYSLYQVERNKNGMYDLKASTESQVYNGICGEDPRTDHAVDATRGLVLVDANGYLPALYHACCGGHTEDAHYVFNDHPALIGVPCSYCSESPHFEWESRVSPVKIRNEFLREYYRMGPIRSINIIERTPSGRVETLFISHSLGQEIINGKQIRALIGYNTIRSTLFSLLKENDTFIFKGRGWGHGVGLCQWGAKAIAEHGARYRDILSHYYPVAGIESAY